MTPTHLFDLLIGWLALLDWKPPALVLPGPTPPPLCPCCQKPMGLGGLLPRPPP